jgi:hypothetical protein
MLIVQGSVDRAWRPQVYGSMLDLRNRRQVAAGTLDNLGMYSLPARSF